MNKNELLKDIPQIETILQAEEIKTFIPQIGHTVVADVIRIEVESFRSQILADNKLSVKNLHDKIIEHCRLKKMDKIQRVINCTGVVIHTNLGRSPLGSDVFNKAADSLGGYCNLEYHLASESRGKRGGFAEKLICSLTGAEDALIVNNNASSVFLILSHFAKGKEAIVSRGELIQIGGGFRIPDIMKETGAKLVECGTTNITTIDDYKNSITEDTSMIFSAHQSNYRIEGFTESPTLKDISTLKNDSILYVRDLGSGNMLECKSPADLPEPSVRNELAQGPDLVCFSGDKLLGGCQAGIIVGKKDLIAKLRKDPLMRMLRVDKITYFILQETLLKYDNGISLDVELHKIISKSKSQVDKTVSRFIRKLKPEIKKYVQKISLMSTYGGGALPALEFESSGVLISIPGFSSSKLYSQFVKQDVPIVGTVVDDKFTLNFSAVFEHDIPYLVSAIEQISG